MNNLAIIKEIRERYDALIDRYTKAKVKLQEVCSHDEKFLIRHNWRCDGGYYDKDQFFTDFHCLACDKRWTSPQ